MIHQTGNTLNGKLLAVTLALLLIGALSPAFADDQSAAGAVEKTTAEAKPAAAAEGDTAETKPAAKPDNAETTKGYILVQSGQGAPEVKEVDITAMQDDVREKRRQYATANLAQEMGLGDRPPLVLRQIGLMVDQAMEGEDVASLVSLSLSLAAFEKAAGKQAQTLRSGDILRIAEQLAKHKQDKTGMTLVALAYQDATFALADSAKSEEMKQLAANTRLTESTAIARAIALKASLGLDTGIVKVDSWTRMGLSIYTDGDRLGYVSGLDDEHFLTTACNKTVLFQARDSDGDVVAQRRHYLRCGNAVTWTIGRR